jgi:hypothetical protein
MLPTVFFMAWPSGFVGAWTGAVLWPPALVTAAEAAAYSNEELGIA